MIHQRKNFYIITGCSGGGKSTIIEGLRARGVRCVEEAGREIVKEQLRSGGDGIPWQNVAKFRDLLLARYIELFMNTVEPHRAVFFDRAIPEVVGASRGMRVPVPEGHLEAVATYIYARKVFVTPPWPEIFTTDAERRHSYETALEDYEILTKVYPEFGYQLIEIPREAVSERIKFILGRIDPGIQP